MPTNTYMLSSRCQQEALDKGLAYLQDGDQEKALTCFQDAVHVTPDMVDRVKKVGKETSPIYKTLDN